jgi:exopolyphosphatase/guanosine-5'-triphosphate,3'-diphosphate pyrophosphatase
VSELIALVELGSNATRCLLARITPRVGFRVLAEDRVQTRLGGGRAGVLPGAAVEATLRAVRRFLRRARDGHDPRVVAVATAAVREAENRERLLGPLRRDDGIAVRVLSPRQEARLGAIAAVRALGLRDGVVADLGGGSLQLTRLRAGRLVSSTSLPLGAVRSTRRFLRHDPPTSRELRALRRAVREGLLGALPPAQRGEDLVALGGTVRTLARMHLASRGETGRSREGLRLHQSDVTAIRERIEGLPQGRRRLAGLKAERADVILAGAIVVEELMTFGGYLSVTVTTHGVRDGLLLRETFDGEVTL